MAATKGKAAPKVKEVKKTVDERAKELIPDGSPKGILILDEVERGIVGVSGKESGVQRGYMKFTYLINSAKDKGFASNVAENASTMAADKIHDIFATNNSIRIDDSWVQTGWEKLDRRATLDKVDGSGIEHYQSIVPPTDAQIGQEYWRLNFDGSINVWKRTREGLYE